MPQRSPLILWLLLAATVSVDAVAFSWVVSEPHSSYATVTCDALIISQLSIICIWSALSTAKTLWTRIAPAMAVSVAVVASLSFRPMTGLPLADQIWYSLAFYGSHAALLLTLLWLLQGAAWWRVGSGNARPWRYSLAQLLIVMTVVAVLATAVRESPFFGDDRWMNPAFVCSTVAIAVASVWIWAGSQPWILRLGGTLGLAILLAGAVSLTVVPFTTVFSVIIGGHYLIQSIVLSIWLGCGPILTFSKAAAAPGPPTTLVQ